MVGKRKKERLTAFHRANILESACKLFQKNGIDGTTMDDIAKHAEYSKTTIYNYFESKEDLVSHLTFEGVEFFKARIREDSEKSKNFSDFYEKLTKIFVEMHAKRPSYYAGIAGDVSFDENAPPTDLHRKIYLSGEETNQIIAGKIADAIAAKEIALDGEIEPSILFILFCIMGIVENSAKKEDYITYKVGKSRNEFLDFAFHNLFQFFRFSDSG